jgi:hypothetical protein
MSTEQYTNCTAAEGRLITPGLPPICRLSITYNFAPDLTFGSAATGTPRGLEDLRRFRHFRWFEPAGSLHERHSSRCLAAYQEAESQRGPAGRPATQQQTSTLCAPHERAAESTRWGAARPFMLPASARSSRGAVVAAVAASRRRAAGCAGRAAACTGRASCSPMLSLCAQLFHTLARVPAGPSAQIVCTGCRTVLLYPAVGAAAALPLPLCAALACCNCAVRPPAKVALAACAGCIGAEIATCCK